MPVTSRQRHGDNLQGHPAPAPALVARETLGWRRIDQGPVRLWFKGYLVGSGPEALARRLVEEDAFRDPASLNKLCVDLDGHFAWCAMSDGSLIGAVDRVRSIPLFIGRRGNRVVLSTEAPRLLDEVGDGEPEVDADQFLSFAMSGFTFPGKTLFRRIEELDAGEFVFANGKDLERHRYYGYRPWRPSSSESESGLRTSLAECTLSVFEKLITSAKGRPIVVPLSAGLDSRLVVSALHHLGFRDVHCYSYGKPGNHEANAAKAVAEALGFAWTFFPHSVAQQSAFLRGEIARRYVRDTDTFASVPFQQDLHAVLHLLETGRIPRDALVVNGQSGDFISGNHIPASLVSQPGSDSGWNDLADAAIAKHFSLWRALKTPPNTHRIAALVRNDLEDFAGPDVDLDDSALAPALYEASEYRIRQAKYVVNGQRIYEFAGLEWRLPLWDRAWVDFWERVPVRWKVSQTLYRTMLMERDWGRVWHDIDTNRRAVPGWIGWVRLAAKAMHAPAGRKRWHDFEERYLAYWMDLVANYAITPYRTVVRDRRGHRNAISWHAEAYLRGKGLDMADLMEPAGN